MVLGKLEGLVRTMSGTQRAFLDAGDIRNVAVYAQNMADTNAIYARVAMVLEKLLIAERNQDMKLLDDVRASLPGIDKDAQAVRSHLARQECRDLFDNAAAIWKEFSGLADRLASLQQENAKTSRARIDLYMGLFNQAADMMELTTRNTTETVNGAETTMSSSTTVVTVLLGVVLALGAALSVLITRMVVGPLARTQMFAQAVAGGDLDRTLDVLSNHRLEYGAGDDL